MDEQVLVESAKAVQETAKMVNTALETLQKSGSFVARLFEEHLREWIGEKTDSLRARRFVNGVRLHQMVTTEMAAAGIPDSDIKKLPLNFLVHALDGGSLEENEDVLELWARLLANSTQSATPRIAFVSILKEMSPFDARVFAAIYSITSPAGTSVQVVTEGLPDHVERTRPSETPGKKREYSLPSDEVIQSLANLERLGVAAFGTSFSGAESFDRANQTTLGRSLFNLVKPANAVVARS